jgi:hypothetical protein
MPIEPRKAGPAERKAQIVEKRQPMSLVREQWVGAEKWHHNAIWAASAYVCLVQIVTRTSEVASGKSACGPKLYRSMMLDNALMIAQFETPRRMRDRSLLAGARRQCVPGRERVHVVSPVRDFPAFNLDD